MEKLITILTPTYNRRNTISKLYKSLLTQTSNNFLWMIIDDGSTDDTEIIVNRFIDDKKIDILYFKKENGGKHTALNFGIKRIVSELTFIVDSDDYLVNNAIEIIYNDWQKYENNDVIAGLCYLKGYDKNSCIGMKFPLECISSFIKMRIKLDIKGDKAEVFRTKLLIDKPFPEIEGEKFIGEDYVWCDLGKKYSMAWKNKIIYIAEYLPDGLSLKGRKLRIQCPVGGMLNSGMMLTKEFPLKFRLKKAILYNCYYFFADKEKRELGSVKKCKILRLITFPAGFILYYIWKKKYL